MSPHAKLLFSFAMPLYGKPASSAQVADMGNKNLRLTRELERARRLAGRQRKSLILHASHLLREKQQAVGAPMAAAAAGEEPGEGPGAASEAALRDATSALVATRAALSEAAERERALAGELAGEQRLRQRAQALADQLADKVAPPGSTQTRAPILGHQPCCPP